MTEFFAGMFVAYTLPFFIYWAVILLLAFISIIGFERYWPTAGLLILSAYLTGLDPTVVGLKGILLYTAGYLLFGFAWIWLRWVREIEKLAQLKDEGKPHPHRGGKIEAPKWEERSYDYASYFFYWPIDALVYLLSDVLSDLWDFISNQFKAAFNNYAAWRLGE